MTSDRGIGNVIPLPGIPIIGGGGNTVDGLPVPSIRRFALYRQMRNDPTISLARRIARSPLQSAEWSFEGDELSVKRAEQIIRPVLRRAVKQCLTAMDYGFAAAEVIPAQIGDRPGRIKPLLADNCRPIVDEHGELCGMLNGWKIVDRGIQREGTRIVDNKEADSDLTSTAVRLRAGWLDDDDDTNINTFIWHVYESEAGYLYGRARNEDVVCVYLWWVALMNRVQQYVTKIAGVTPIIGYPIGQARDSQGVLRSSQDMATTMMYALGKCQGVAVPKVVDQAIQDIAAQANLSPETMLKLGGWTIDYLEASAQHGQDLSTLAGMLDAYKMRGWGVPERAATEGSHGTLAEAEAHANWVMIQAQEDLLDVAETLQLQLIDVWCPGVVLKPEKLVDQKAQLVNELVKAYMTAPIPPAGMEQFLDLQAILRSAGLPIREEAFEQPQPINVPEIRSDVSDTADDGAAADDDGDDGTATDAAAGSSV